MKREGDYLGTYSGNKFWPLDPRPEEVCLEDISHALSQICRFNGHTTEPYSVALHCLSVERLLEQRGYDKLTRLYGLLHDAAEAYVCDLPRPLKRFIKNYGIIELAVMDAVYKHFGLDRPSVEIEIAVGDADDYILALEAKKLMKGTDSWVLVPTLLGDSLDFFEESDSIRQVFQEKVLSLL